MDCTRDLALPEAAFPDSVIRPRDTPRLVADAKYKNPFIESYGDRFRKPDGG